MLVRFWGVRGSTPTPSTANLKYGGNTACVEVRTSGGQLLILDAGSGIRALGHRLSQEEPADGHRIMLFLSHYHWDHIQGIPFFEPMYEAENFVYIHGFKSSYGSLEQVLSGQMANPYFPVSMGVMQATRHFYTIGEETLQIGDARLSTRFLNHPQGCLAYRVEDRDRVFVYATDHEHGNKQADENLRQLAAKADVLVYDAQYTPKEYLVKAGWGHSTWEKGVCLAREVGVRELILFHHDPDHGDAFLDSVVLEAGRVFAETRGAVEGMETELEPGSSKVSYRTAFDKRYKVRHALNLPLKLRIRQLGEKRAFTENISLDGAYLLADHSLEVGQEIEVEIELAPPLSGKVSARARVVRCKPVGNKMGIGISFH